MPDRIAAHYDRNAQALDRARRESSVERPWLDRFLLGVPRNGDVLDLGCGAGEPIDRYLIDHGRRVTGVDLSERLVALARTRFPRHLWLRADMRKAAMGKAFHGILAWDSLYHLRANDQREMIEKMARWLEPNGALLFNSSPRLDEREGPQFDHSLYHAGLEPWEYRECFAENGLAEIAFAPDDEATGGRSVWLVSKLR